MVLMVLSLPLSPFFLLKKNLFFFVLGISMALMVLSAAEPVRRYSYELFLALHLMAFPVLVFSVLHVRDTLFHLILPLILQVMYVYIYIY